VKKYTNINMHHNNYQQFSEELCLQRNRLQLVNKVKCLIIMRSLFGNVGINVRVFHESHSQPAKSVCQYSGVARFLMPGGGQEQ
jgi:hypothetical protein